MAIYLLLIKNYTATLTEWTLAYLATTAPDHGQISEIAGYVKHHTNGVYNVSLLALSFLFLSCYPLLVQTIVTFRCLQASDSRNSGIFTCSNYVSSIHVATLLCAYVQRSRLDSLSSRVVEVRIARFHCTLLCFNTWILMKNYNSVPPLQNLVSRYCYMAALFVWGREKGALYTLCTCVKFPC